tara:strand:- start:188 stop:412 length:225 start_codon:yes stop_codon:yes gene_type:complete
MKYLLLPLIFVLTSCSLNKNSTYWNENLINDSIKDKKLLNISKKKIDYKNMTFEEFKIFLKDYSDKADFPDLND